MLIIKTVTVYRAFHLLVYICIQPKVMWRVGMGVGAKNQVFSYCTLHNTKK